MTASLTRHERAVEAALAAVNERLKVAKRKVAVCVTSSRGRQQRGLFLRATVPPKPDEPAGPPSRKRIRLPLESTVAGIQEAEHFAIRLDQDLRSWRTGAAFNWTDWDKVAPRVRAIASPPLGELMTRFKEKWFFDRRSHEKPASLDRYWRSEYQVSFNRLNLDELFSVGVLRASIEALPPNSRIRMRQGRVCSDLAQFADCPDSVVKELKEMGKGYSSKEINPRDIPDDVDLLADIERVPDRFRWCLRVIYLYGCRPHELWFSEVDAEDFLVIDDGKTGGRDSVALTSEIHLVAEWKLKGRHLPGGVGANAKDPAYQVQKKLNEAINDVGIGWDLYDLRHAWARRSIRDGVDIRRAARNMGHSVRTHERIYNRWISRKSNRDMRKGGLS